MSMTPEQIVALTTAACTLIAAVTTMILAIRNAGKTAEIHAMVKTDATPAALDAAKPEVKS